MARFVFFWIGVVASGRVTKPLDLPLEFVMDVNKPCVYFFMCVPVRLVEISWRGRFRS